MSTQVVVHMVAAEEWDAAGELLEPESLAEEGFVHLSRADQVAWVANQRFTGRTDLVLLVVSVADLPTPLVWEDCYETGQEFPHLYSPLPRSAVLTTMPYLPGPDGVFPQPAMP